jgi:hypothetical protein
VALQCNTTVAQIQTDNNLDGKKPFTNGQQLTINCAAGVWSAPYGFPTGRRALYNAMMAQPSQAVCPEGAYAVRFYIKPSKVSDAFLCHRLCVRGTSAWHETIR